MKKCVSVAMLIALSLSMISGCGSKNDTDKTESSGGDGQIETISMYYPVSKVDEDLEVIQQAVNDYIKDKINVAVELHPFEYGQWFQQYSLFLSGTENIDILANYDNLNGAVSQGAALDITDLVQEYGQDILSLEGEYIKCGQVNGVQYTLPNYTGYAHTIGIEYRADIVRELGLEDQVAQVKSLQDWESVLEKVKEEKPDMTPFATLAGATQTNFYKGTWDSLGNDYGVLMNGGESAEIVNLFETDEYKNMCELMYKWNQEDYSNKDIQTQADTFVTLTKNDAAFSTIADVDFYSGTFMSTTTGVEIGAIPLSDYFATTYTNVMWQIMSTSEHHEAAMKFLNLWFSDDELASLIKYGIEGQHYQVKDDGTATYLDGQNADNCTYHNGTAFNGAAGIRWETEDKDYAEKIIESNETCKKSSGLEFSFDSSAVLNEITQLDNVCSKYRGGLECGTLDPETVLPEFNEELKKAGIDTVIAEKERQFNEWLTNQK